ncbi:MAG TPA: hypothetical protein DCQ29_09765 [Chitinophagaceae bacterium]|nr:hypothetical protein [Chitinophagaceae bacterium]
MAYIKQADCRKKVSKSQHRFYSNTYCGFLKSNRAIIIKKVFARNISNRNTANKKVNDILLFKKQFKPITLKIKTIIYVL